MELIKKEKNHAFMEDIFLLGRYSGERIWLAAPSWKCDWYWGFGCIESYTNDRFPDKSSDINMLTHYDTLILNNHGIYTLGDVNGITECTLNTNEQWELSDLMKSFYTLRNAAELFNRGHSNYTTRLGLNLTDKKLCDKINKEIMPSILDAIIKLLTP